MASSNGTIVPYTGTSRLAACALAPLLISNSGGNRTTPSQNQNSNNVFDQIRPHLAANIANNMSNQQMVAYLNNLLPGPSQGVITTQTQSPNISPRTSHTVATTPTQTPKPNPGFCDAAWRTRTDEDYARRSSHLATFPAYPAYPPPNMEECRTCGARFNWPTRSAGPTYNTLGLLTPQFFFESHLPLARNCTFALGCLVCLELDGRLHEPMEVDAWLAHMGRHLARGDVACTPVSGGAVRRRAECPYKACPRFHA